MDQSDSSIGVGTNAKSPEPKEPSEEDSLSSGLFFFGVATYLDVHCAFSVTVQSTS
jgi:hypothetical protein